MASSITTTTFLLLLFLLSAGTTTLATVHELEAVKAAQTIVLDAKNWVQLHMSKISDLDRNIHVGAALNDCARFYDENEYNLAKLVSGENHTVDDAKTWLSGVLTKHRTCIDGLSKGGFSHGFKGAKRLTTLLGDALALYDKRRRSRRHKGNEGDDDDDGGDGDRGRGRGGDGLLGNWNPESSNANFVVSLDGSGTHTQIMDAIKAVTSLGKHRTQRIVIYVKEGVYREKIKINQNTHNVMMVGDGMDRTIITGDGNNEESGSTLSSATFAVSGEGFWARDITFENTAGPEKHQAVAITVASDKSIFYRCGFKGFQDTLYAHTHRQFYRDCRIYGTVDFIFGNAASVFQNCEIFVRRPSENQHNLITAQGRQNPDENTAISIIESRVRPTPEFDEVKNRIKTYLGRPWKQYSRTVFIKTDLDGLIDPRGWLEWEGTFGLSTLFYGEYMNTGEGSRTEERVRWPGYHVFHDERQASPFSVENLIQGDVWLPQTGVPFNLRI